MESATKALGPDGRSLIEVSTTERDGNRVFLGGTACVYEGNVLIAVESGSGERLQAHAQASQAGPQRGDWSIELEVPPSALLITVCQEEMEEARNSAIRRVTFVL